MRRRIFKSKLHRATITEADLHYEGSLTIDPELMEAADILEHEEVHVWNVTNGSRLTTYAISGERGARTICLNGAAAHLGNVGDLIIIATFAEMEDTELKAGFQPKVVLLGPDNDIVEAAHIEIPGPATPRS